MASTCPRCGYNSVPDLAQICPICETSLGGTQSGSPTIPSTTTFGAYLEEASGKRHELKPGSDVTIGAKGCTIVLTSQSISGRVATLVSTPGGEFHLRNDSGKVHLNGQFVVFDTKLADGDSLEIGGVQLVYRVRSASPKTPSVLPQNPKQVAPSSTVLPGPQPGSSSSSLPPTYVPSPPVINISTPSPSSFTLQNWNKAPAVEGKVTWVEGPHSMERQPGFMTRMFAAAVLGAIKDWMATLALSRRDQYHIWNCRIDDFQTGQQVSVIIIAREPRTLVQLGDTIAAWGKIQDGNVLLDRAFVYNTQSWINPRR